MAAASAAVTGYRRSAGAAEVGFVARRHEDTIYGQVATAIAASAETRRREYAALEAIAAGYPKYVLTRGHRDP